MTTKELSDGCKIGLEFDLGPVAASPYGSADKLCGVIPLLRPHGVFKRPAILDDPERFERWVHKYVLEFGYLWGNELDETVRRKVTDALTLGACTNPTNEDADSPVMGGLSQIMCIIFAMDDAWDQLSEEKLMTYDAVNTILDTFGRVLAGDYKSLDDVPCPFEPLLPYTSAGWNFINYSEKTIPNYSQRSGAFRQETLNLFHAYILLMAKGEEGSRFSPTSKFVFLGYLSGLTAGLEYEALLVGATVGEHIRNDVLFHRVKLACSSACNLMNDVFGIKRDIKLDQKCDTSILLDVTEQGLSLQSAFDKALKLLLDDMNDIKVGIQKLRFRYAGDEGLIKYLECAENLVDGELHCYTMIPRYGSMDMRLVPL